MADFTWFVDSLTTLNGRVWIKGWAFHTRLPVRGVVATLDSSWQHMALAEYGMESPDVALVHGEVAARCRFKLAFDMAGDNIFEQLALTFLFADDTSATITGLWGNRLACDPYHLLNQKFFDHVNASGQASILELGSRNRSGFTRRSFFRDNVNGSIWVPGSCVKMR